MAEFIREEVDMDCCHRPWLTASQSLLYRHTPWCGATDIVPGDTVKRRIVGYLGHDGKTGCGAKFTNIRVVCQNTLTAASNAGTAVHVAASLTSNGANNNFESLSFSSIDTSTSGLCH